MNLEKMTIRSIRAYLLNVSLTEPLEFSFGQKHERCAALLEVTTDQGLVGWGEANWGGTLAGGRAFLSLVEEKVKPALLGKSPFSAESIWRSLDHSNYDANRVVAAGAVDVALFDLQGQALGMPLCEVLGGACRKSVPVYASDLMIIPIPSLVKRAQFLVSQGFTGVKMRVGRIPEEDPDRVRQVREAIGPKVKLFIDANCGYNRREALRVGAAVEIYDLEHFEEPLPKWDIDGYADLSRHLHVPIAAGECTNLHHMKNLMTRQAAQVIQPDVTINGFTETRKILALAETFQVDVVLHSFETALGIAASLQLAAAYPMIRQLQELDQNPNPLRDDLLQEPLQLKNGSLQIPQGPGLGIHINQETLKRYLVAQTVD